MSGSERRNLPAQAGADPQAHDPSQAETLEVVPGAPREALEGWVPELASEDDLRQALEEAFQYRGNITITRKDGSAVEGYIFDRRTAATLRDSCVRLIPKDTPRKLSIPYSDIAALSFSGHDMAAGRQWENWVRTYWERKTAGEKNIGLSPEPLE